MKKSARFSCGCQLTAIFCITSSVFQKYCFSIYCEHCFLTVTFIIPVSVECGIITVNWFGGLGVSHCLKNETNDYPSLELTKRAPSSASTADTATNHMSNERMCIGPFNFIGCLSCGSHPRKKCLALQLLSLNSQRYKALEWTLSIM